MTIGGTGCDSPSNSDVALPVARIAELSGAFMNAMDLNKLLETDMSSSSSADAAVTEFKGEDHLLWYARAIYRSRWFCLVMLLNGIVWGLSTAMHQPLFRTVAILRGTNPLVGYHHRGYWEPQGRTLQSQVRTAAESLLPREIVRLKSEQDPWLLRLEIQHEKAGDGEQIVQQVLDKVRAISVRSDSDGNPDTGAVSLETSAISSLLGQMQQILGTLRAENNLSPLDLTELPGQPLGQRYASDVMLRMPFDELPLAGRFRQLQLAVDRYFADVAGKSADPVCTKNEQRLLILQSQVMQQMLINWGRMDLFASVGERNSIQADLIYEYSVSRWLVIPRELLLRILIASGVALLAIVPSIWVIDYWPLICAKAD